MAGLDAAESTAARAGISLILQPINATVKEEWRAQLEDELLTLLSPDGRVVMMLPRPEAAAHLRFQRDLLRGPTVSFVVVEGLKAHRFRCQPSVLSRLLDWLPQRSRADQEQEVRLYGIGLAAVGAVLIGWHEIFPRGYGTPLVLLGLLGAALPRRAFFIVNGVLLFALGLALLYATVPGAPLPPVVTDFARIIYTGLGSLMLMGAIQQWSLTDPGHQLRSARARRRAEAGADVHHRSRVVMVIAAAATGLAVLFAGNMAGALWIGRGAGTPASWSDTLLYVAFAAAAAVSGGVLWIRRHAPYYEAKLAGQLLAVLLVLYVFGQGARALTGAGTFTNGVAHSGLYVLPAILVAVLVFNRWFARAVDRELGRAEAED